MEKLKRIIKFYLLGWRDPEHRANWLAIVGCLAVSFVAWRLLVRVGFPESSAANGAFGLSLLLGATVLWIRKRWKK